MKNYLILALLAIVSVARGQDSTDAPVAKKFGLICFPLSEKAGFTYCAGKEGQFKIENTVQATFSDRAYFVSDELRFLFAWKRCGHKKFYSGFGVGYEKLYNDPDQRKGLMTFSITPIGIEWFPFRRVPKFGITIESYMSGDGPSLRPGLSYYF